MAPQVKDLVLSLQHLESLMGGKYNPWPNPWPGNHAMGSAKIAITVTIIIIITTMLFIYIPIKFLIKLSFLSLSYPYLWKDSYGED